MKATKIKMQYGCRYSQNVEEISQIYIEGCTNPGFFDKDVLHDYLKKYPNSIYVDIYPYPYLIPAVSKNGEKYVKSAPNQWTHDNLLDLPRE